jgi:hypothetical protein
MRFAARPALEEPHLDRIARLVSGEGIRISEPERALLLDLAASAGSERDVSLRETTRLLESSLTVDAGQEVEADRERKARGDREVFRPHDDNWAGRLAGLITLRETEALALAVNGDSRNRFESTREDIYTKRNLMELTRTIRAASGMTSDAPSGAYTAGEERSLERYLHDIANGLRSRGDSWEEWQATGVGEFKHILPKRERERASRVVEYANVRLETERRAEALERLESQFESAAQVLRTRRVS